MTVAPRAVSLSPYFCPMLPMPQRSSDMMAAIRELPYRPGRTNTAEALRYVRNNMFNGGAGDRSDVTNVVVILTDGGSNNKEDTFQ